ncbi:hypothetical protein ACI3KY_07345 [Microbacterium sp. ZW T2_14]|uniref:hypothetical protein n=1 Tax=Microbacterium sp. ZW T2_14 TaxID=3378079 RepID=UPI00385385ED
MIEQTPTPLQRTQGCAQRCRRRWAAVAVGIALVGALAGCATSGADDLYDAARQTNLLFKSAVGTVQLHLYDGDWQVQEYGDAPVDCGSGYSFVIGRTTPEGWTLDADAMSTAHHLAGWLTARGWTTTDAEASGDGIAVVEASNPAFAIASLVVEVRDGQVPDGEAAADAIGVHAEAACQDGDADALAAVLFPGSPDAAHDALPVAEPAGAVPVFGFTADGHPR